MNTTLLDPSVTPISPSSTTSSSCECYSSDDCGANEWCLANTWFSRCGTCTTIQPLSFALLMFLSLVLPLLCCCSILACINFSCRGAIRRVFWRRTAQPDSTRSRQEELARTAFDDLRDPPPPFRYGTRAPIFIIRSSNDEECPRYDDLPPSYADAIRELDQIPTPQSEGAGTRAETDAPSTTRSTSATPEVRNSIQVITESTQF